MINQKILDKEIINAKRWIAINYNKQEKELINGAVRVNSGVCMAVADFKCQKCRAKENLQFHHLIMRKAKDYMDFWRYASQRYYWANIIILCKKHHKEYHGFLGKDEDEMEVIGEKKLNILKKKFKYKE